jgi:hypothetical protein
MKPVPLNDMSAFYLNCRHFLIRRLAIIYLTQRMCYYGPHFAGGVHNGT